MINCPRPIQTDASNPFANRTLRERLPAILRETRALNPDYSPRIHDSIQRLHDELVGDAKIRLIETPAPDYDDWQAAWFPFREATWQRCQWFFAEVYHYRLLMEAVRWWETGRDPFAPKKAEEYAGAAHRELLARALAVYPGSGEASGAEGSREERLATLLELAVWGNRIDLSYAVSSAHGSQAGADDLLVDERARVIAHLLRAPGDVHIIADNAGSELSMDLALAALLLTEDLAPRVVLHLKLHPTFVSDATVTDVLGFLAMLRAGTQERGARQFGAQLESLLEQGRLRLAPDAWWNSTAFLYALPPRLQLQFANARLAIIKGDANYRRMVYDSGLAGRDSAARRRRPLPLPAAGPARAQERPGAGSGAGTGNPSGRARRGLARQRQARRPAEHAAAVGTSVSPPRIRARGRNARDRRGPASSDACLASSRRTGSAADAPRRAPSRA